MYLRHVGIVVTNLDKSLYFYRDLLGLEISKGPINEHGMYIDKLLNLKKGYVTTIKLQIGDAFIELLYYHSHPREPKENEICQIGLTHIALTINNINELYTQLIRKGVKFNSAPQKSPDGYAIVAFCRDPDNNFIELVEVL